MKKILALFLIVSIFASSSSATFTRREKILSAVSLVGTCAITIVSLLLLSKKQRTIVALNLQLNDAQQTALNLFNMARFVATHWENERDAIIYNCRRETSGGGII